MFHLGLALLVTHELDAVRAREWRVLPGLRSLPDARGRTAFILVHVPLFAVLFWFVAHPDAAVRVWAQAAVDLFLIVHVGLHRTFTSHPEYDFHGPVSRGLIIGAGLAGVAHLVLLAA